MQWCWYGDCTGLSVFKSSAFVTSTNFTNCCRLIMPVPGVTPAMTNGHYIAIFGQSTNISADQRINGSLAGTALADSGYGLIVSQLCGAPMYALRAHNASGGLSMGVVEQQHAELSLEHCDILLMVADKKAMYERIAASAMGAIWLSMTEEFGFGSACFHKEGKPVFVLEHGADVHPGSYNSIESVTDISKAITRFAEMDIAC